MFDGPLLERPVADFREAEKIVSVLTVEIKQCIVKKANKSAYIEELVDTSILREHADLTGDRRGGTVWFDQKTQFAQRLLHTLCHVAKFSLFHSAPLRNIENQPVDAVKLTDGLLWLRWRYDDLRIDLQSVGCGDQELQRPVVKKFSRQFSCEVSPKGSHQMIPAHVSFRRKLNRLERQLLQVAGELRIRFKSVLATQGWGIPGAFLRVHYHIDLPEEIINLQRDANGDYAVWSIRLNNSNFHGMLPTAKLTLMRRHMRETFVVGVCETFLFAVENLDGHNSLRGNRHGLLLFRLLVNEPHPLNGQKGQEVQERQCQRQLQLRQHDDGSSSLDSDESHVGGLVLTQAPGENTTPTTLGPVAAIIVTQVEWRPKNGKVKNVVWPWDSEIREVPTDVRQMICT